MTVNETTAWTTWEELLLSYAVKRHGFENWNSVAMEIQPRTSLPHDLITPDNCKLKYLDLKRRFEPNCIQNDDVSETTTTGDEDSVPWLEDLRNLRVSELRQEVYRSDVSIVSLQLKVKKLEEEREQSLKNRGDDEKPDLENIAKEDGSKIVKQETHAKTQSNISGRVAGDSTFTDEESDRENQSVNESNSTGPKSETHKFGLENGDKISKPVKFGSPKPDLVSNVSEPAGEDSCNESSGTIPEGLTRKSERNASELRDSLTESKRSVEEGPKESSDVQSSARLAKRGNRKRAITDGGAGEALQRETISAAKKQKSVKSQPLVTLMELISSHKRGSLFERRLESQGSEKYKKLVRQHMDLQTIQKRLKQGLYTSCTSKFYRDLLLIFNNAIVFFPKSSPESVTAHELRNLISHEMSKQTLRSDFSPETSLSPPIQTRPKHKQDPEKSESLLAKQKQSAPIVVCRKRSSISSKPGTFCSRKTEVKNEELGLEKSEVKDQIVTGTRSLRRSKTNLKNSVVVASKNNSNNSSASDRKETPKAQKNNNKKEKEKELQASIKKRGAADFLKRIKGSSPNVASGSKSGGSSGGGGGETKRKLIEKNGGRKEKVVLRPPKQTAKEEVSPAKRSNGKTGKKAAESAPVKRRKEEEEASTSKRPKKRSKR